MACPKLWVDLKKIEENARIITSLCAHRGIAVAGVVKGCRADEKVTQAVADVNGHLHTLMFSVH